MGRKQDRRKQNGNGRWAVAHSDGRGLGAGDGRSYGRAIGQSSGHDGGQDRGQDRGQDSSQSSRVGGHLSASRGHGLRTRLRFGVLLLGTFMLAEASVADTVRVPLGADSPTIEALPRPVLGMRRGAVLAQFGEPLERMGPVGDPPISRWRYAAFSVVFEGDTVIHSVVPRSP